MYSSRVVDMMAVRPCMAQGRSAVQGRLGPDTAGPGQQLSVTEGLVQFQGERGDRVARAVVAPPAGG